MYNLFFSTILITTLKKEFRSIEINLFVLEKWKKNNSDLYTVLTL